MKYKTVYPKTYIKTADVIFSSGALPVGCQISNGGISSALTVKETSTHTFSNITLAQYSAASDCYFICADGKVYVSQQGLNYTETGNLPAQSPFMFEQRENGVKQTVIVGDDRYIVFTGLTFTVKLFEYKVNYGVIKNGRLFGVDRQDGFRLRWSGEGGAFDWEENISGAGWVDLPPARGKITGLYVMDGKIIAIREYGLSVISAYGTPENFKVEFTDTSTPKITPQTAAVVCGKLYFISDNRIFCFDGANVYPVTFGLEEEINSPCNAVAYGESYLVCTESKFLGRKAVFVADTEKRTAYLADVKAVALCCGGNVYAVTSTQVCALEKGGVFSFYSGVLNFDTQKRKFIKTVEVSSDKTISMLISNGEQVRTFPNVQGKVAVNMSGKNFKVTLACNGAKVYSLKANAEVTYGI